MLRINDHRYGIRGERSSGGNQQGCRYNQLQGVNTKSVHDEFLGYRFALDCRRTDTVSQASDEVTERLMNQETDFPLGVPHAWLTGLSIVAQVAGVEEVLSTVRIRRYQRGRQFWEFRIGSSNCWFVP